ncbi:MAG: hypothetical protein IPL33_01415 [Sphingobacteriales bacterium]|nr:hypothetical protein [Sphingobacteriales bacterium]
MERLSTTPKSLHIDIAALLCPFKKIDVPKRLVPPLSKAEIINTAGTMRHSKKAKNHDAPID